MRKLFIFQLLFVPVLLHAQIFTKVTDADNPIVSAAGAVAGSYSGCAWIDYNQDGNLDLYWVRGGLFKNNGDGNFSKITDSNLKTDAGYGTTWADFNNDGFIDCFISGGNTRGSSLHKNNGDGSFTKIISGPLLDSAELKGWGSAFADINNDAYADIIIAAPFGFAGITDGNKLLLNSGDENFIRIDTSVICTGTAPYTVPSFSDFDMDGDMDCFIGSGPANGTVAPDYLYKNELNETGIVGYFTRIETYPIGTEPVDGQIWNWIDYDNDGDLDAYLTNYVGTSGGVGMVNNLYRNDDGNFIKMTEADAGPIVSDKGLSLASVWEDFDNDGDLDCYVTNDNTAKCKYYQNNNDGTFTSITTEPIVLAAASFYGATAGDYDRDGDIDLFVSATGSAKGLFQNNASANGNSWVNFELEGRGPGIVIGSNRSAIGAKVKVKANINGTDVWQLREVSAQNSFNSMNSFNVEFGFGDATIIDSMIILWPSGVIDSCSGIALNAFYHVTEGFCPAEPLTIQTNNSSLEFSIYPNPAHDLIYVQLGSNLKNADIQITDLTGRIISSTINHSDENTLLFEIETGHVPPGIYCVLINSGSDMSCKLIDIQ